VSYVSFRARHATLLTHDELVIAPYDEQSARKEGGAGALGLVHVHGLVQHCPCPLFVVAIGRLLLSEACDGHVAAPGFVGGKECDDFVRVFRAAAVHEDGDAGPVIVKDHHAVLVQ
jgi:hypothetical protein